MLVSVSTTPDARGTGSSLRVLTKGSWALKMQLRVMECFWSFNFTCSDKAFRSLYYLKVPSTHLFPNENFLKRYSHKTHVVVQFLWVKRFLSRLLCFCAVVSIYLVSLCFYTDDQSPHTHSTHFSQRWLGRSLCDSGPPYIFLTTNHKINKCSSHSFCVEQGLLPVPFRGRCQEHTEWNYGARDGVLCLNVFV